MENFDKPQIITHIEKSLNYTVFDVKWIPSSAKFITMGMYPRDTGALQVFELSKGNVNQIKEVCKLIIKFPKICTILQCY